MKKSNDRSVTPNEVGGLTELRAFSDRVENAMRRAVKTAIAAHHRDGRPVAIWKDGQVVLWYPDGSYRPVSDESGTDDRRG